MMFTSILPITTEAQPPIKTSDYSIWITENTNTKAWTIGE